MSVNLVINGTGYAFPQEDDENWGEVATNWATAVSSHLLQKTGGTFTLSADVNFGASFGLKAAYFSTRSSNAATAGQVRFANADTGIGWRNAANNANLLLTVDSSNRLVFNSVPIASSSGVVPPSAGGTGVANNDSATLTRSGSHALTITTTGTTNVTLPTSGTLVQTASPTFTGTVTVGSTINVVISSAAGGGSIAFNHAASSGEYNFRIGNGIINAQILSFTPSTAVDGSTFSNPLLQLHGGGAVTVGNATLAGATTFPVTTDASSTTAAAVIVSGGLAVAKKAYIATGLAVGATLNASGDSGLFLSVINTGGMGNIELGRDALTTVDTATGALKFMNGANKIAQISAENATGSASNSGNLYFYTMTSGGVLTQALKIDKAQVATFSGQLIGKGTATNDNAAAGNIGEVARSQVNATNAGTTATWTDLTSISLTAGDWIVTANVYATLNGATVTTTATCAMAISTNSGTTTTDHVSGDNVMAFPPVSNASDRGGSIANYRLSLNATTTVYLKTLISYSAGTPQFAGRISARRMR